MVSRTWRETIEYAEEELIDQDEAKLCELLVKLVKRARLCDEPPSALVAKTVQALHEAELA
jgi:hypothetical protein